jgi:ectoine hydroxylase
MPSGPLADNQVRDYHRDGYVLARGMFDAEEIRLLAQAAREDRALDQHSFGRADGEGGTVRLSLWNHPGDTIYGMVARCESIVDSAAKLLGGEVYHYHSKMIMKDARVGGASVVS